MLPDVIAAIFFVASSGLLFNEKFRSNKFLIACAGLIALASTYYLTRQVVDEVVTERLGKSGATTASIASVSSILGQHPSDAANVHNPGLEPRGPAAREADIRPTQSSPSPPDSTACSQTAEAREYPIRMLFSAWEKLDPNLYGDQWTRDAVQYYGHGNTRGLSAIIENRVEMMAKLQSVTVDQANIAADASDAEGRRFHVSYSMQFNYKSGRVLPDSNDEVYLVRCDAQTHLWKIQMNNDRKA